MPKTMTEDDIREAIDKMASGFNDVVRIPSPATDVFIFPRATGFDGYYFVLRFPYDVWACTCRGYRFGNRCYHIKRIIEIKGGKSNG